MALQSDDRLPASEPTPPYQRVKFADTSDCAAFLAGLSQFLNRPDSWWHQVEPAAIEVWAHPSQARTVDLYLSRDALHAAVDAFALPPVVEHEAMTDLPPGCLLVLGRGQTATWHTDDAQQYLNNLLRS